MSRNGPSMPPMPPEPPRPDPDTHRLARQSVRWAVIGVVVSSLLALAGLYQSSLGGAGGGGGTEGGGTGSATPYTAGPATGGGPGPGPGSASLESSGSGSGETSDGGATPDDGTDTTDATDTTEGADGLTGAEHELRDSLNSAQWSRESCSHTEWQGAQAALYCTVTTVDAYGVPGTGKASVVMYDTKYARDVVFQSYAGRLQPGNCDDRTGVYGTWRENNTGDSAGDVVCFLSSTGQYVFLCSYYDRPALVQISGPDQARLVAWWHTMEPVFTG